MCRPNHGKLGESIELMVNFKLLKVPASLQIYCYHVDVLKMIREDKIVVENRYLISFVLKLDFCMLELFVFLIFLF